MTDERKNEDHTRRILVFTDGLLMPEPVAHAKYECDYRGKYGKVILQLEMLSGWPQFAEALVYDRVDHRLIDRCSWFSRQSDPPPEDIAPNTKLYTLRSVWI